MCACVAVWRSDNGVQRINEVTLRRARLVLGWVTVFGRANFRQRLKNFLFPIPLPGQLLVTFITVSGP